MEGFETFLYNTSVLYNLLVVYALVQALALILMLCSFIQRWSAPAAPAAYLQQPVTDYKLVFYTSVLSWYGIWALVQMDPSAAALHLFPPTTAIPLTLGSFEAYVYCCTSSLSM